VVLDLSVIALLAVAAVLGASTGALRQSVQLGAALIGWLAARHLSAPVGRGLEAHLPRALARPAAGVLLFLGGFALASLLGHLLLRATRLSRAVRGPADRGGGALLGGAKAALAVWVLLSALALLGRPVGPFDPRGSDCAALASAHNVLVQFDPESARALRRLLHAARDPRQAERAASDPAARRLLSDPRVRALDPEAANPETVSPQAQRVLDDPEIQALIRRLQEPSHPGTGK
jgi:membrane protein required for colicin V production